MTTANTNDPTVQALLARIQELETAAKKAPSAKETTITLSEYKGHPVVKFEGNFRPFNLGFGKIRAVLEMADRLKKVMDEHAKK